ncbi:MAG TPA: methyltransferase domain-containing protein, partial [Patescibacteria group bacterium]|nr:methyltransferase domain-containing protein [Patescibacteria group bacterium]
MKFFRNKTNPNSAGMTPPELLKLVESLTSEGKYEEAFDACEECLKAGVTLVDAHYMATLIIQDNPALGINANDFSEKYNGPELQKAYADRIQYLQSPGRTADALALARELRKLAPENNEVHIVAGILCLSLGRAEEAIDVFESALEQSPGDVFLRTQYIRALLLSGFDRFDQKVRRRLGLFLKEPGTVNLAFISRLWLAQLTRDRAFAPLLTAAENSDYAAFRKWLDGQKLDVLLIDDYFLDGVRNCVIADVRVEKLLVYLRRALLDFISSGSMAPIWALPLAVAIGEQCFINEYVFDETEQEKQQVALLAVAAANSPIPPLSVAVLAAYRPLHTLKLKERTQDKTLQSLLRQQIDEPAAEADIKKKMKTFSRIADETSQKVRAQYEEHPYPRWISFGRLPDETDDMVLDNADRLKELNILVAGCATGHFPMRVALNYPQASVTGIDISLSSLAYGVRKAKEMGFTNIEFLHGDILDVGQLGKKFDIIFSLGVLHHMGDPEKGWRSLVDVLKPGG